MTMLTPDNPLSQREHDNNKDGVFNDLSLVLPAAEQIQPMKYHNAYYKIAADNNYELGLILGQTFGPKLQALLEQSVAKPGWQDKVEYAKNYIAITAAHFPQYLEELRGYARAANVNFDDLWTLSLESELSGRGEQQHCTTMITNGGKLIAHNEDWEVDSQDNLYVLQKTVGDLTILEFNYFYTLGGNAVSINSNGFIQSINSLTHSDQQLGIPANIIGRWLSETGDPEADFRIFSKLKRGLGYNHNIIGSDGKIYNIESSSSGAVLSNPKSPFVHTNHYLDQSLKQFEANTESESTNRRYQTAHSHLKDSSTVEQLIELSGDISCGTDCSIMNDYTIGRMIIELDKGIAKIWMRREASAGWIDYPLDFIAQ